MTREEMEPWRKLVREQERQLRGGEWLFRIEQADDEEKRLFVALQIQEAIAEATSRAREETITEAIQSAERTYRARAALLASDLALDIGRQIVDGIRRLSRPSAESGKGEE